MDTERVVVPLTFGGVDLLVQAVPVTIVGSEPTSAASRVMDAYARAEPAIRAVAQSVAGTIEGLLEQARRPREVEVEFGLAVSVEGDVILVRGTAEASLAIRLCYEVTRDTTATP